MAQTDRDYSTFKPSQATDEELKDEAKRVVSHRRQDDADAGFNYCLAGIAAGGGFALIFVGQIILVIVGAIAMLVALFPAHIARSFQKAGFRVEQDLALGRIEREMGRRHL